MFSGFSERNVAVSVETGKSGVILFRVFLANMLIGICTSSYVLYFNLSPFGSTQSWLFHCSSFSMSWLQEVCTTEAVWENLLGVLFSLKDAFGNKIAKQAGPYHCWGVWEGRWRRPRRTTPKPVTRWNSVLVSRGLVRYTFLKRMGSGGYQPHSLSFSLSSPCTWVLCSSWLFPKSFHTTLYLVAAYAVCFFLSLNIISLKI